jgi:hypothetical protein
MTIQLLQSEVARHTSYPFERLPLTMRKEIAIKILRSRGDWKTLRNVEMNLPNYSNFAVVAR